MIWPATLGCASPDRSAWAAGFDKDSWGLSGWGCTGIRLRRGRHRHRATAAGKTRLFRLREGRALLNRMGFNNHGAGWLASRLAWHRPDVPIGVNIGGVQNVTPPGARRRD